MSTPRFYCWDDDGSPGRALSGNLQNRLKQILVPCLVTGYGDKPGAGWTIGHEHPNGFSLINADGNVVNFVSNLPAQAPYPEMKKGAVHVYTAESLSDTSNAFINGANLCSGFYRKGLPEPSGYTRHGLGNPAATLIDFLTEAQWTLVADENTFTFSCTHHKETIASYLDAVITFYCGKVLLDVGLPKSFLALGGDILAYDDYDQAYTYSRGYSSPINYATGLAESVVIGAAPYIKSNIVVDIEPTEELTRLNFQQPRLVCGGVYVGRLRGVVYDDLLRSLYGWRGHLKALGLSGNDYKDRGKLVEIDGYHYAFARSHAGGSILTDNPAFW